MLEIVLTIRVIRKLSRSIWLKNLPAIFRGSVLYFIVERFVWVTKLALHVLVSCPSPPSLPSGSIFINSLRIVGVEDMTEGDPDGRADILYIYLDIESRVLFFFGNLVSKYFSSWPKRGTEDLSFLMEVAKRHISS